MKETKLCMNAVCTNVCDMSALLSLSSAEWIQRANERRLALFSSPEQSHFRVTALLAVTSGDHSEPAVVEGANAEQGYIGGAICAERAALCKLRFLHDPKIWKIIIVTDSQVPISPGALCREYLSSHAASSTPLVIGNRDGSVIVECKLSDLQPYPYVYRLQGRQMVHQFALDFSASMTKCASLDNSSVVELHAYAMSVIRVSDIHPITFAAAVQFRDGTRQASRFLPGNEYGCSLDPVSQLVRDVDRKRMEAKTPEEAELALPEWIIQVDQHGVCHAPFAAARSLLTENGLGCCRFIYHTESGECEVGLVDSLLPLPPHLDQLAHDSFPTS